MDIHRRLPYCQRTLHAESVVSLLEEAKVSFFRHSKSISSSRQRSYRGCHIYLFVLTMIVDCTFAGELKFKGMSSASAAEMFPLKVGDLPHLMTLCIGSSVECFRSRIYSSIFT